MSDSGRVSDFYRDDLARCARDWATTKNWTIPEALRERLAQFADAMTLPQPSPAGEGAQETPKLSDGWKHRGEMATSIVRAVKDAQRVGHTFTEFCELARTAYGAPSLPPERAALVERLETLQLVLTNAIDVLWAHHPERVYVQFTETTAQTIREALREAVAALRGETE